MGGEAADDLGGIIVAGHIFVHVLRGPSDGPLGSVLVREQVRGADKGPRTLSARDKRPERYHHNDQKQGQCKRKKPFHFDIPPVFSLVLIIPYRAGHCQCNDNEKPPLG